MKKKFGIISIAAFLVVAALGVFAHLTKDTYAKEAATATIKIFGTPIEDGENFYIEDGDSYIKYYIPDGNYTSINRDGNKISVQRYNGVLSITIDSDSSPFISAEDSIDPVVVDFNGGSLDATISKSVFEGKLSIKNINNFSITCQDDITAIIGDIDIDAKGDFSIICNKRLGYNENSDRYIISANKKCDISAKNISITQTDLGLEYKLIKSDGDVFLNASQQISIFANTDFIRERAIEAHGIALYAGGDITVKGGLKSTNKEGYSSMGYLSVVSTAGEVTLENEIYTEADVLLAAYTDININTGSFGGGLIIDPTKNIIVQPGRYAYFKNTADVTVQPIRGVSDDTQIFPSMIITESDATWTYPSADVQSNTWEMFGDTDDFSVDTTIRLLNVGGASTYAFMLVGDEGVASLEKETSSTNKYLVSKGLTLTARAYVNEGYVFKKFKVLAGDNVPVTDGDTEMSSTMLTQAPSHVFLRAETEVVTYTVTYKDRPNGETVIRKALPGEHILIYIDNSDYSFKVDNLRVMQENLQTFEPLDANDQYFISYDDDRNYHIYDGSSEIIKYPAFIWRHAYRTSYGPEPDYIEFIMPAGNVTVEAGFKDAYTMTYKNKYESSHYFLDEDVTIFTTPDGDEDGIYYYHDFYEEDENGEDVLFENIEENEWGTLYFKMPDRNLILKSKSFKGNKYFFFGKDYAENSNKTNLFSERGYYKAIPQFKADEYYDGKEWQYPSVEEKEIDFEYFKVDTTENGTDYDETIYNKGITFWVPKSGEYYFTPLDENYSPVPLPTPEPDPDITMTEPGGYN